MRDWLLVLSPVLIVVYFLIYPAHLSALMAMAMGVFS
jgi:hypothetical protein